MLSIRRILAPLVFFALCGPGSAQAGADFDQTVRELLGGDPAAYRETIKSLQKALQSGDAATAAMLVQYPIEVEIDGERRVIRGPAEFAAAYQLILPADLVAAVAGEPIKDMTVTIEGVMLGQGEIRVSAVCEDEACTEEPVRIVAIQTVVPPAKAVVGKLRRFGDWTLGCDNRLGCTLVGVTIDGGTEAHAILQRRAGPAAEAGLWLVLGGGGQPRAGALRVSISGGNGTQTWGPYPLEDHAAGLAARVPDADARALIAALKAGDRMTMAREGVPDAVPSVVSLRGTAAALLAMDERQGRVGTETALTRPGPLPATAVPDTPLAPEIDSLRIRAADGMGRPDGVPADPAPGCEAIPPRAFDLGKGVGLWGRCISAGAYNVLYEFWLVRDGQAEPARFDLPGRARDKPQSLFDPTLAQDGRSLTARYLGRGLGDCGVITDWAWTGTAFAPLRVREIDPCGGVDPSDWPILWTAN